MFEWANTQDITVTEIASISGTGKPVEKPPVTVRGRIEPTTRRITDARGNEVIAGGFVMFPPGTRFAVGSTVEWQGQKRNLIKVEPCFMASTSIETHVEGWFK